VRGRRFVPRLHYELLICGLRGHRLVGIGARVVEPSDALVVQERDGVRWHRCVRCDAWIPLPLPDPPTSERVPGRDEVELPLRGKALRDKIVLRVIAVDRALHFVVLALLAVAVLLLANHESQLRDVFYRALGTVGGGEATTRASRFGIVRELDRIFRQSPSTLRGIGLAIGAYALLEGIEAVGLWFQKRWAEYLTLIATALFIPLEVYEIVDKQSVFRIGTLIVNLAVVAYLLYAKRLFGIRGGPAADEAERARDNGWPALEASSPEAFSV
jgi:uncharacterized membrane protein (DUF2068 family)